jgi:RNase P subunit RPR2
MTAEQRTVIEPKDVIAIELRCECGTTVRYPLLKMQPEVFRTRQHMCPNCKEPLARGPETNRLADLAEAITVLIKSEQASVRLEIANLATAPSDRG